MGEILVNGHLKKFDEKNFDEFHKINTQIYLWLVLLKKLMGKTAWSLITITP